MDGLGELWMGHPSRGETRTSLPQPARRQILNALDYKEEIHRTSVSQANEDARFARGAGGLSASSSPKAPLALSHRTPSTFPLPSLPPFRQRFLDRGQGRHSRGEARRGDGQQGDLADLGG